MELDQYYKSYSLETLPLFIELHACLSYNVFILKQPHTFLSQNHSILMPFL